jgi:hypothetical protein
MQILEETCNRFWKKIVESVSLPKTSLERVNKDDDNLYYDFSINWERVWNILNCKLIIE